MEKKNIVFGLLGFIFSILALLLACGLPLLGVILAIAAFVLSIIGCSRKYGLRGLAIAGIVISCIASITCILFLLLGDETSGTISNTGTTEKIDNTTSAEVDGSAFDIKEYHFNDGSGYTMYVLVVKNNSDKTIDMDADVTASDDSGKNVGVSSDYAYNIAPNQSGCMQFYFDTESASTFKYNIDYRSTSVESIASELTFTETQNDDNVIITCKNDTDCIAYSVRADIIFFNGDTPVGCDFTYLCDDDLKLDIGKDISKEIECYQEFDNYKVYYSAYK